MTITSTISPTLKFGLQFFGFWPGVYSTIYWLSHMLSILIMQYFQYLYVFDHLKISELSNLVDSLISTLDYSLTFFKLGSLWIRRRVFHKILVDMDNDWRECSNIDQHLHAMTIKANISHFLSNALLSFYAIVGVLYLLGEYVIRFVFLTENYNDTTRQFPLKIQFPFEAQQSPIFEFIVAIMILHGMLQVWIIVILNGLIFTLVLHVSGQIDIIRCGFKNISKTFYHGSSISSLRLLIERHNRVILFSKNTEQLFSFIALIEVIWNTLVICGLGFIIVISIHNETGVYVLVKTGFAYLAMTMNIFNICFAGEYLSHEGKLITSAIYETLWYDMPSNQNKILIFVIMRSQKRLAITAGKMMDMSFETFTKIMKMSASYVSILMSMY